MKLIFWGIATIPSTRTDNSDPSNGEEIPNDLLMLNNESFNLMGSAVDDG